MSHELRVRGDGSPRRQRVFHLLVLLDTCCGGRGIRVVVAGAHVYEMGGTANVPRRAVLKPQFAHLAAQLALKGSLRDGGGQRADLVLVSVVAILFRDDGLGDCIEAFAGPDLLHEGRDVFFGVVEDGLDEGLQGRVARLEALNVLFVDALAAVV